MPVGSVGKWLVLGTLVATLGAGGCKEDDGDNPTPDAGGGTPDSGGGGTDSGTTDAGPKDSGVVDSGPKDAGVDSAITCGSLTCYGYTPNAAFIPEFPPGCVQDHLDATVCGLSTNTILMGADPKFLQKDAPGKASPACGAFYDALEPDAGPDGGANTAKGDGKVNTTVMIPGIGSLAITYPGCCTARGYCSTDTAMGVTAAGASNGGYGCLDNKVAFRSIPVEALRSVPCDPATGDLVDAGASGDAGTSDSGASDAGADGGNS